MATATDRNRKPLVSSAHFSSAQKQLLRRRLLAWYAKHARDLPWRKSQDPYRVWISEIMLQQTQVATVREYFTRFVATFPTVHSLAAANEIEVLRLWEGLGYYRRRRQLHAAAMKVVADHAGEFPHDLRALQSLPGIGRYTAGAIASIAFNQRAPILEANTIRLFSRLIAYAARSRHRWCLSGRATHAMAGRRRSLTAQPHRPLQPGSHGIRLPRLHARQPQMPRMPARQRAGAANAAGLQHQIPLAKPRQTFTEVREAAVVIRKNGGVLLRRCGEKERWAGLWDFPRFEIEASGPLVAKREITAKVAAQTGIACARRNLQNVAPWRHTISRITLDCYEAAYLEGRVRSCASAQVRGRNLLPCINCHLAPRAAKSPF